MEKGDWEYLERKGVFDLPTERFRTHLLNSYILWVHPHVPVLDLSVFVGSIAANDGINRVSLLLLHSVFLVAIPFVDITHILQEGYSSRKEACNIFYCRVKVCVMFDAVNLRMTH